MFGSDSTFIYAGNAEFVEELYQRFLTDPRAIDPQWRQYFESLNGHDAAALQGPGEEEIGRLLKERLRRRSAAPAVATAAGTDHARKQAAVFRLIQAYRLLGHHRAQVDPINLRGMPVIPDLDPQFHGLTEADLDTTFNAGSCTGRPSGRCARSSTR
jgi:2-oxoglutarate dehydrogenase E1 component